jgi:hypothetical protein
VRVPQRLTHSFGASYWVISEAIQTLPLDGQGHQAEEPNGARRVRREESAEVSFMLLIVFEQTLDYHGEPKGFSECHITCCRLHI